MPIRRAALALTASVAIALPAAAQTVLDPAAPLGIQAGRFTILPAVETTAALTTGATVTPGWSIEISPEVLLRADWSLLQVELFFDASISPVDGTMSGLLAEIDLRFDPNALWSGAIGAGFAIRPRDARDAALPDGVDAVPNVRTLTVEGTLEGTLGHFDVAATVGAERNLHDDAFVGGVPVDQSERDNLIVTAAIRVEAGDAILRPFVEAEGGRRFYDQPVDGDGFLQGSNFATLRAGFIYDSVPVLTAEIGFGYHWEIPDDPALSTSASWTIDGEAVWSPREPIVFQLAMTTAFTPDASPDWGDSVSRAYSIAAGLDLTAFLQLAAEAGYGVERYSDGTMERSASAGGGVTWTPTPQLQFSANYLHSWLWSPDPTREGASGLFSLTARVQR